MSENKFRSLEESEQGFKTDTAGGNNGSGECVEILYVLWC